jgi:hypothetical protein
MLIWVIAGSVPEQQMNGGIDSMNWISISSSSMPGEALGYHGAAQVEVVRYMHDLQVQPLAKYIAYWLSWFNLLDLFACRGSRASP